MEKNIFEIAVREKYTYNFRGLIKTEDLYDLKLTDLDTIYKGLKSDLAQLGEDSLIDSVDTEAKETINNKIEIVKAVVDYKREVKKNLEEAKTKAETKRRLKDLIAQKKNEELVSKSLAELEAMLASL
ncbi:MAG: hypothetical protein II699_07470 [Lachnospiraceae bacterium]|nr:hypothetical protein [Lachnospiraceae bacterium]